MWRRLFLGICVSSALVLCWSAAALAAGGEETGGSVPVEDFTADDLYRLCGIDPADEEAAEGFLTWLSSLSPETSTEDFILAYIAAGYAEDGLQAAAYTFCLLHELDPETFVISNQSLFRRFTGDNVCLLYIKPNTEGVASGWYLGWTNSPSSSSSNSDERLFNLTEMQKKLDQVVVQSDLSSLETILNTINSNIQKGNKSLSDYLPGISTLIGFMQHVQPDVASIKDDLVSFTDYLASREITIVYPRFSGTSYMTNSKATGIMDLLAKGFGAVAQTTGDYGSAIRSQLYSLIDGKWSYSSPSFDDDPFGFSISSAGATSSSGYYNLLMELNKSLISAVGRGAVMIGKVLNGDLSNWSVLGYYYDDNGELQSKGATVSNPTVISVMSALSQMLSEDMAALRFVLADADAIRLHAANKPLKGAVEDSFTGGSPAAPGVDDIKGAADISGQMQALFDGNPATSADFFGAAGGEVNYDFFSENTAAALDVVAYPAAAPAALDDMEQWLADIQFDDRGFGSLKDSSYFSVSSYLGD